MATKRGAKKPALTAQQRHELRLHRVRALELAQRVCADNSYAYNSGQNFPGGVRTRYTIDTVVNDAQMLLEFIVAE